MAAHAADRSTYPAGTRPQILINWESFESNGFPASWRVPFQNVVINSYTRLNRVLGVDVRPQFAGYTTRTDSEAGEIVISANEKHAASNRLASTFGFFPDRLKIVFHRKRGSDLTPWNWTPFWNNPSQFSMQGVLMHELQHALGLDHSAPSKTIMNSYTWTTHHGPWSGDISDIRGQYVLRDDNRLRQLASYDGGFSWSTLNNDLTTFGNSQARTTNKIAAAGNSSNHDYVVGWTTPGNFLSWVRGDGVQFSPDNWTVYSEHPRPRYGGDMASNHGNTWMWVVVDGTNDDNAIKVLRSQDNASTWSYTAFPSVQTSSTPGIATTRIGGRRAWIVTWVNYDESDRSNTGFIYTSVSFDNGSSWSAAQRVDDFYRVHDGVSLACNPTGACRVAFVWAGELGSWEFGQNKVRSFELDITPTGAVSRGDICIQTQNSRVAPALTWHASTSRWVQGIREQDYNTSLDSMSATITGCPDSFQHLGGTTTHTAPALAENPSWTKNGGGENVMWFSRE